MYFLGPDISDVLSPVKGFQVVNQVVRKLKIGKEGREGETHSGWDFEPCCIKIKTGSVLAGEVPACPSSEAGVLGGTLLNVAACWAPSAWCALTGPRSRVECDFLWDAGGSKGSCPVDRPYRGWIWQVLMFSFSNSS